MTFTNGSGAGPAPAALLPEPTVLARRATDSLVLPEWGTDSGDAPIIRLLNEVLAAAIEQRASDVHLEPHESDLLIRFRIDGILFDWQRLDPAQHAPLVSRVKVLAGMDIAERRLPLDGRFTVRLGGKRWDVRVSTVPSVLGEKAVLRLLPKDTAGLALEDLGMQQRQRRLFEALLARPHGMILVTGPTGAGKTTTLYAALQQLDCIGKNILTIEDPVEYELPRVTQIQVHAKIGLSFAAGLRHILRQDPDILMVGEIRDAETLEMAVQAALTGHLVLSTLHCNDAAGAAPRALDMGLEPFLFTSAVTGVIAQRLVRRVCPHCRVEEPLPPSVRERFEIGDGNAVYYRGVGCGECRDTGYRGRLAVFETLMLSEAVKQAIHGRASAGEIRRLAVAQDMIPLQEDAIEKVLLGLTTPEEVLRAVSLEGGADAAAF